MVRHQAGRSYRFALGKLVFTLYASQLGKNIILLLSPKRIMRTGVCKDKSFQSRSSENVLLILCISQFQQCPSPPPPPGNSGAFSHTFHPGGRGIRLPSNYPGAFDHPTFFHLTTSSFPFMTISSANTVSFFLNTSR